VVKHKYKNMNLLWSILTGLAAGFLTSAVMKGHCFGLPGNLIVGVIGALLGGFLLVLLALTSFIKRRGA
jgi:uncharacterized membrane protein YeaQ/YmgE (transglycosylase-associated protein family)